MNPLSLTLFSSLLLNNFFLFISSVSVRLSLTFSPFTLFSKRTPESRPPKLMTTIILSNVAAGPTLSSSALSYPSCSFFPPLSLFLILLPRQLLAIHSLPAALSSEGRAQRRGGGGEGWSEGRTTELNREIHRCHRCTFSICRLPPSFSLLSFFFIYRSLLIPSIHFVDGSTEDYLHLVSRLPGFLLVVRPAGGSFFGGPYWPGGGKITVGHEKNSRNTDTASILYNSQGSQDWNKYVTLANREPARRRNLPKEPY